MNNREFIVDLAQKTGLTSQQAQRSVRILTDGMAEVLETGENIPVQGFGTFEVRKRLERVIVNPATKERMLVPPKLVLAFKASSSVKEKLKNKTAEQHTTQESDNGEVSHGE